MPNLYSTNKKSQILKEDYIFNNYNGSHNAKMELLINNEGYGIITKNQYFDEICKKWVDIDRNDWSAKEIRELFEITVFHVSYISCWTIKPNKKNFDVVKLFDENNCLKRGNNDT